MTPEGRSSGNSEQRLNMAMYNRFPNQTWWFSIVMLIYQKVSINILFWFKYHPNNMTFGISIPKVGFPYHMMWFLHRIISLVLLQDPGNMPKNQTTFPKSGFPRNEHIHSFCPNIPWISIDTNHVPIIPFYIHFTYPSFSHPMFSIDMS